MTFRDEREAALQRAAALQQDLDQARDELAQLRARLRELEAGVGQDDAEIRALRERIRRVEGRRGPRVARTGRLGTVVVAGIALVGAGLGVAGALTTRRASPPPSPPRATASSVAPSAVANEAAPTPAPAAEPVEPVAAPAEVTPAGPERVADLAWDGELVAASGVTLPTDAPCRVEGTFAAAGAHPRVQSLTVRCADQVLYRSTDPVGSTLSEVGLRLEELTAPDGARSQYELDYHDRGTRTGVRSQVEIDSILYEARVWRDAPDASSVTIHLRDLSAPRAGDALLSGRAGPPNFGETLDRAARVARAEGRAPVARGARCRFTVRPTWLDREGPENCRVAVWCGATWVYGRRSSGFANCLVEGGHLRGADDQNTSSHGGDPAFRWRGERLTVRDDPNGDPWSLEFALGR